jgi:hypothetical protein
VLPSVFRLQRGMAICDGNAQSVAEPMLTWEDATF